MKKNGTLKIDIEEGISKDGWLYKMDQNLIHHMQVSYLVPLYFDIRHDPMKLQLATAESYLYAVFNGFSLTQCYELQFGVDLSYGYQGAICFNQD